MRLFDTLHRVGLLATFCASLLFLSSCSEETTTEPDLSGSYHSETKDVGNGSARAYVTLNADGNPTEVGIKLTEDALEGLPEELPGGAESDVFTFTFPVEAAQTIFKYMTLDWNPHGHEPMDIFTVPHFDFHFYMMEQTEVAAINPADADFQTKAENVPATQYIPADYITPPPVAAVPQMGVHWIDSQDPLAPGAFTEVFIFGSWDGNITFMEPMITLDRLKTKTALEEAIKQPQAYQHSKYYPTTYTIRFDDTTKEYIIALGGMTMRQAS